MVDIIRVSTRSRTGLVAGSIAHVVREHGRVDVRAIGVGAVYQATLAIVTACKFLRQEGLDIVCIPTFVDLDLDGETCTAINWTVEVRTKTGGGDAP